VKYEDIVINVCGEDWQEVNSPEREGGFGVACLLAYMNGADASAESISKHLGVAIIDIQLSYSRLMRAGLFSQEFNAREDKWLLGKGSETQSLCAWCHIAAIAGDIIYRNFGRPKKYSDSVNNADLQ
jgi:hypothetical protein